MHGKKAALAWSFIHTFADTLEEKILLRFNEMSYLFWINVFVGTFVTISALIGGIEMSWISFLVIIVYTLAMIGGNVCYAKAIQMVPISLANLIDSGSLFIILICDVCLGYIKPKFIFILLFCIFFLSVYIFSKETDKMKEEITNKKVNLKGIFILITSTIFYASEPYFIKLANAKGANEFGINAAFYFIAIPFYFLWIKLKKQPLLDVKKEERKSFFKDMIILAVLYAITDILALTAYVGETPILVSLIFKLQVFFIVILAVIRRTDKMNWKKTLALIVGMISIILMSFVS